MKSKYTESQLEAISKIQSERGITRKSAVRFFEKQLKAAAITVRAAKKIHDVKRAAANDRVEEPRTEAGSARAEGLRLYKLAGRPKKNDFVHVYGKAGVAATWERRAVMVGLSTAASAAMQFQAMLAKPKQSCLVAEESKPATKGAVA